MWCGWTLQPHKESKWERNNTSAVVSVKPHCLATRTAERSVSTTPRLRCRALDHHDRSNVTVKAGRDRLGPVRLGPRPSQAKARRVGARTHEGDCPKGGGPKGGGGPQNFALVCPLPAFPSLGIFSWNFGGVWKRRNPQFSGCRNSLSNGGLKPAVPLFQRRVLSPFKLPFRTSSLPFQSGGCQTSEGSNSLETPFHTHTHPYSGGSKNP